MCNSSLTQLLILAHNYAIVKKNAKDAMDQFVYRVMMVII